MELKDSPAEAEFRAKARAWLGEVVPSLGGPEPPILEDKLDYWRKWQRLLHDAGYAGLSCRPSWPSTSSWGAARMRRHFYPPSRESGSAPRGCVVPPAPWHGSSVSA